MMLLDAKSAGPAPEAPIPPVLERLAAVRALSREIAAPLSAEDQAVQVHDDASPTKWHLAHATWFFEELVLKQHLEGYRVFDDRFGYCFNSYYESLGPRHPRPRRGLLTRPSAEEVMAYRDHVDAGLERLAGRRDVSPAVLDLIEIAINHEQQHQELMLTDILALFAENPLRPVYRAAEVEPAPAGSEAGRWRGVAGGVYEVGHRAAGFAYDNEGPSHQVLLRDFKLFSRPVTNGEWIDFIDWGGYTTPTLWLADGWAAAQREGWEAPGYWQRRDEVWHQMTLHGLRPVERTRAVTHISYYEADAFSRWAGTRLPTEFEWEVACRGERPSPCFDLAKLLPPLATRGDSSPFGGVWQWTQSAYLPYPGYKPFEGALGEYNGKFMCNQFVLRGGSIATPDFHIRPSYRNFFYPHQRWQFTGLRLATDA